jgi:HSP20 family protein
MATQTDQKSIAVKQNDQQQSSQRKDIARAYPRSGILQRRVDYPFGLMPHELFDLSPFSLLRRMTEEMDRAFQEVGMEREGRGGAGWAPAIEVSQRDGKYYIQAELPGMDPKDVKVEVENDALIIQGERKFEHEEKDGGVQRTERQYGAFYRSIPLPPGANVDQAQAKFNNGVLEVAIPAPGLQTRRSIPVQGESASSKSSQSHAA